ncbi:MAG TPA: hypothetical protein VIV84_00060 [Burkholderiaceae bacterium]
MKTLRASLTALAGATSLVVSLAWAQAPGETQKLAFDRVSIVNSGPDLDEVERIKRMSHAHPLRVLFSGKGGDYYVADRLMLRQRGEVLADLSNAGPLVLVDLPAGAYELQADFGGQSLRRAVTIGRGGMTLNWVVPKSID